MPKPPEHRYLTWAIGGVIALVLGCSGLVSCLVFTGDAKEHADVPVVASGTPSPSPSPSVALSPSAEPLYFKTCTDAVRAGVPLPVRSNEPGYRLELDGDEDGKACE